MKQQSVRTLVLRSLALGFILAATRTVHAQDAKTPYPNMAPVDQYLMERNAEIVLARSAAPDSISKNAQVMVLGRHGYETAVKGTDGFVCLVERGWTAPSDNPDFWNPKLRGPICLNAAAARTYLPLTVRKTELVLAAHSKDQMFAAIKTALDTKELPGIEPGAMSYMMSKHQYLGDQPARWHPHLMFFTPLVDPAVWGAGVPGSPLIASPDPEDRLTIFMITLPTWSDGSAFAPAASRKAS
jgi:hypothetical protein